MVDQLDVGQSYPRTRWQGTVNDLQVHIDIQSLRIQDLEAELKEKDARSLIMQVDSETAANCLNKWNGVQVKRAVDETDDSLALEEYDRITDELRHGKGDCLHYLYFEDFNRFASLTRHAFKN